MSQAPYRSRFAPSPSGDLHLGSLVAAIASYCQAKAKHGEWLVRIEDVDETRTVPGAAQQIIDTLARYGLYADGPIIHQTDRDRLQAYQNALDNLQTKQLTYPCYCTRKQLAGRQVYPGTCRGLPAKHDQPHSIRLKTQNEVYAFEDLYQGSQTQSLAEQSGDFNIKRKDGLFCYQLAVVVDDARQQVTDVVRGDDLLESAARQQYLYRLLEHPTPNWWHVPLVRGPDGRRLAKRHGDTRLAHFRAHSATREQIIGLMAYWCGMTDTRQTMSTNDFLAGFDITQLAREDVVLCSEDIQCLG